MERDFFQIIFGIKEKLIIFDPYNVLLAISANILMRPVTGFVIQGHKYELIQTVFLNGIISF